MDYELKINKTGFVQVSPTPSEETLNEYYSQKYWQGSNKTAQSQYNDLERHYLRHKAKLNNYLVSSMLSKTSGLMNYLDVGCGEGWDLAFAHEQGFKVKGFDYSSHGVEMHNPKMLPFLTTGDIYKSLDEEIGASNVYEYVLFKNVLEHVREPDTLLNRLKKLISKHGVLCIQVPNDFSELQKYLLEKKLVDKKYWVVVPDHLNYFNKTALDNFFDEQGFEICKVIADYPIELDLLSSCSNYVLSPEVGKEAHQKRLKFEELISHYPIEKVINYYSALAEIGLGRCLNYFLKIK